MSDYGYRGGITSRNVLLFHELKLKKGNIILLIILWTETSNDKQHDQKTTVHSTCGTQFQAVWWMAKNNQHPTVRSTDPTDPSANPWKLRQRRMRNMYIYVYTYVSI